MALFFIQFECHKCRPQDKGAGNMQICQFPTNGDGISGLNRRQNAKGLLQYHQTFYYDVQRLLWLPEQLWQTYNWYSQPYPPMKKTEQNFVENHHQKYWH